MACGGEEMASLFLSNMNDFNIIVMFCAFMSIISTACSTDAVIIACSELFKCEGSYDMYGDCGGVCKPGFLGDHCLERGFCYFMILLLKAVTF